MPAARCTLAVVSTLAFAVAIVGPAHAATIATDSCVRTVRGSGTVPIAGTGFMPGALVSLRSSPAGLFASATTDAAGNFATTTGPASFNPFSRQLQTFEITATDTTNPALVARTKYKQVRVGYTTNPSSGRPTRKATHTVRGFAPGRNIYLHFRYHGQTKRNVKVGKANSPCGVASKRMRLLPTRSRPGTWTVYADQKRSYSKKTKPQLKYSFVIRRTFG